MHRFSLGPNWSGGKGKTPRGRLIRPAFAGKTGACMERCALPGEPVAWLATGLSEPKPAAAGARELV
jgi:hypothetical protein